MLIIKKLAIDIPNPAIIINPIVNKKEISSGYFVQYVQIHNKRNNNNNPTNDVYTLFVDLSHSVVSCNPTDKA